ncbi:sodium/proline symporter [Ponticaulis sp.]|uniref:sodium/proline symporter n=1 Tax=Ponticaulis sp. TaxID=2020902 RepID=UPI000C4D2301|nr:sodium/proline symporter [Ponticaulis sp.]MAF58073.1 sodium:proline symporter [Ponticaulis sp.]MBN03095.1 sodium:proline symporter [Ponticaulis sp.]
MANLDALITLIIYSAGLVGIGFWASKNAQSEDAFILADRSLGSVVAGLAYAASTSSAWVLLGFSGFVYAIGPSAMWMVPGILAGYAVVWFWSGKVLQEDTAEHDHLTLTDFVSQHTDSPTIGRLIRIAASLIIAFSFSWYIAAQLQGAGQAFNDLFDSSLALGVVIGAALILVYTFLGGFVAVSIVDTVQGALIGIVAVILPAIAFFHVGGFPAFSEMLAEAPPSFSSAFGDRAGLAALGFVIGLSATGFGALGQPHLVAWIMAARDKRARIEGGAIACAWGAVVYTGMGVLGLAARIMFGEIGVSEGVFFGSATELLPGIFAGIVAAATLSAIMSTVDSQLLVAGAALSHDLGLARLAPKRKVLISRLAIILVCIAAVGVTLLLPSSIFERVLFAWVALGATFGPIVVARTIGWTPRNGYLLASMLTGFFLSLALTFLLASGPGGIWTTIAPWVGSYAILTFERFTTRK